MNDFPASLGADAPMVRFAGVSKRYGDLTVLDRLELDVAANEMVSIIGPSGSARCFPMETSMGAREGADIVHKPLSLRLKHGESIGRRSAATVRLWFRTHRPRSRTFRFPKRS